MMTFKVQFHRYSNGQGRFSAVDFIQAEDFRDATAKAALMVSAMRSVDPTRDYTIVSVACQGYRGDECVSGWETNDELSARVLRGMSDADLKAEAERLESHGKRSDDEDRYLDKALEELDRRNS
jgi:hypothetical protein